MSRAQEDQPLTRFEDSLPTQANQAYEVYKPSEINWIQKIPAHWQSRKAQYLFRKVQRPIRENDEVITAFRDGQVTLRRLRREEGYTFAIKEIGYQGVRKGDLIISAMDAFAGAIGISDSEGKCSPVYSVCEPFAEVFPHFYGYMLQNMAKTGFITSLSKGIRERSTDFRFSEFKVLELPLPPLSEQRAIVAYLDRETAHLDALLERKNRLLELLEEQRRAVISQAVTRGLNPDARLKDSGVPWLGLVPEGWEVQKLAHIVSDLQTGPFGSQLHSEEYVTDGIPVINPSQITNGQIIPDNKVAVSMLKAEELQRHKLSVGDIVFARRGEMGRCGLVTVGEAGWLCGTGSIRVSPDLRRVSPPYLLRWLTTTAVREYLELTSVGSTMDNLNTAILGRISIPLPNIAEQQAIAAYLDQETAKLDALRRKLQQSIGQLREYRAALITAAVTGQVDVRGEEATA